MTPELSLVCHMAFESHLMNKHLGISQAMLFARKKKSSFLAMSLWNIFLFYFIFALIILFKKKWKSKKWKGCCLS